MPLIIGEDKIKSIYVGDTKIQKAYKGNELIYSLSQGGLPEGYIQLVHISPHNTNTSYIHTGAYYPYVNRIEILVYPKTYAMGKAAAQYLFYGGDNFGFWRYPADYIRWKFGTTTASNVLYSLPTTMMLNIVFDFTAKKLSIKSANNDTVSRIVNISADNEESKNDIQFFSTGINAPLPSYIYGAKFYDKDENILCDFVPAKDPSGAAGFYDIARKVFYGGQNITAGPEV